MSQEKTLDNTQISNKDVKELEKGQDNKLNNTSSSSSSTKKSSGSSSSNKSKSKKDNSYTDSSDKALGVEAQAPIDSGNPAATSLQNIQNALSDPALKKDFLSNVADLLGQYQRRKLTDKEVKTFENLVEDGLLTKVFKLKKTV